MKRWTVIDRDGREIYLTEERWEHIISKHDELEGRLDEVLKTIRLGRRTKRDPRTFIYYRRFENLPDPYDTILVFIAFGHPFARDSQKSLHRLWVSYLAVPFDCAQG